jgi:hypothetical protein
VVDVETLINLEADEAAVASFLEEHGGCLECDPDEKSVYWLTLRPRSELDQAYFVRVAWTSYPHEPPSVKFATGIRGSLNVTSAWPVVPGYRPGSYDICKPFTAEGFSLHAEWRSGPEAWRATGNPFLWVATTLQSDMNNSYAGRSG